MDRDRAVKLSPIADGLAGVIADPTVDCWHGVVGDQLTPRLLVVAGFDAGQPSLNVLARWTARVAGWQQVDVERPTTPHRSSARTGVQQVRQRREVPRNHGRAEPATQVIARIKRASSGLWVPTVASLL